MRSTTLSVIFFAQNPCHVHRKTPALSSNSIRPSLVDRQGGIGSQKKGFPPVFS